ncbi:MAG: BON domain-containing protein [Candidatus Contendobacter sp.]
MKLRTLFLPALLATLTLAGCAKLGLGSSDSAPSATRSSSASRGPTVSDSAITASIKEAFQQDPELAAAKISVTVDQGVVSLGGSVPNVQAYLRAGSLARNAPGVRPPVNVSSLQYPR